jgi:actin-related protein 6
MSKSTKGAAKDSHLLPPTTFVLDNGAFTIKAGLAPDSFLLDADSLKRCREIPNSLVRTRDRRIHTASQQASITQWSEATFRRPIERGQLVNWETQKEIWNHSFFDEKTAHRDVLVKEFETTTLLLTEAPNTMHALQRNADEIILEEWGFGGYARVVGGYVQTVSWRMHVD